VRVANDLQMRPAHAGAPCGRVSAGQGADAFIGVSYARPPCRSVLPRK